MWIFKDFPLNFRVTTWRFSQWIATITFIGFIFIYKEQYFGSWHDIDIVFTSPFGIVALIASLVAQFYVYGGFITNTAKDILVPAIIIAVVFVVELMFAYVLKNLGYTAQWDVYLIRYALLLTQSMIQFWVFNDVEFKEIPADEINKIK